MIHLYEIISRVLLVVDYTLSKTTFDWFGDDKSYMSDNVHVSCGVYLFGDRVHVANSSARLGLLVHPAPAYPIVRETGPWSGSR